MREKRREHVKALLKKQEELGGIKPSDLKDGTQFYVETEKYIYKFTKVGSKLVIDSAAPCVQTSSDRFVTRLDSHDVSTKHDINDWVGLGLKLIIRFNPLSAVMVGDVTGASIIGPENSYDYRLWESKTDLFGQ